MRVIYALLYYYLIGMVGACVALVLLVPKFSRRIFFRFIDKVHLSTTVKFLFYGIMLINFVVLADSVNTYFQYQDLLTSRTTKPMQRRSTRCQRGRLITSAYTNNRESFTWRNETSCSLLPRSSRRSCYIGSSWPSISLAALKRTPLNSSSQTNDPIIALYRRMFKQQRVSSTENH